MMDKNRVEIRINQVENGFFITFTESNTFKHSSKVLDYVAIDIAGISEILKVIVPDTTMPSA